MSRAIKVILGVFVGLLVFAVGAVAVAGVAVARSVDTNESRVAEHARQIADFTPPAGYTVQHAAGILGCTLVAYESPASNAHVFIAQIPRDLSVSPFSEESLALDHTRAEFALYRDYERPSRHNVTRTRAVGTRQAVIRGEPTTLQVREGWNSKDQPYREVSGVFEGKGGMALLTVSAPIAQWDEAGLDAFITSIN